MRVLVVGGHARSLINFRGALLKSFVDAGHEVLACAAEEDTQTTRDLVNLGVAFQPIPLSRAGLNPLADWATFRALQQIMKTFVPDTVLAYTAKPVIYASIAARWTVNPVVYSLITGLGYAFGDGTGKRYLVRQIVKNLYRFALQNSAGIFFQNEHDLKTFVQMRLVPKTADLRVINGSGVDLNWFQPMPLPDAPVFILIARLLADKGIREYIDAARELKRKYGEARFLLAGGLDPNPASITRSEIDGWEREGVVEYLGILDDVRAALQAARFFVLPTYYREGLPRTILEAMATGRPIITTGIPGCRDAVIHGENGLIVPPRSRSHLREAMEQLLEQPDLAERMARKSLYFVREKYDVRKVNAVMREAMQL
jgi:glycosyltransferase involved in cell wall biosynthesis